MNDKDHVRWESKVVRSEGCWHWTGTFVPTGYGKFSMRSKNLLAHRVSYEHFVGPIPAGLELDHLCRNRACVNPAHLEPVTHAENLRRGTHTTKSECVHGHAFTPENTYVLPSTGRRYCRTCRRIKNASAQRKLRLLGWRRGRDRKWRAPVNAATQQA